jgi:hypothetical protein
LRHVYGYLLVLLVLHGWPILKRRSALDSLMDSHVLPRMWNSWWLTLGQALAQARLTLPLPPIDYFL